MVFLYFFYFSYFFYVSIPDQTELLRSSCPCLGRFENSHSLLGSIASSRCLFKQASICSCVSVSEFSFLSWIISWPRPDFVDKYGLDSDHGGSRSVQFANWVTERMAFQLPCQPSGGIYLLAACAFLVEKCMNADATGFRVPSMLFFEGIGSNLHGFDCDQMFPMKLGKTGPLFTLQYYIYKRYKLYCRQL